MKGLDDFLDPRDTGPDPGFGTEAGGDDAGFDRALRIVLPAEFAEVAGAVLMDLLGPFEEQQIGDMAILVFYPAMDAMPALDEVLAALPPPVRASGRTRVETRDVSRKWVDGWKDHFRPLVIGDILVLPPWVPPPGSLELIDVVINPGLGFGTGLHPTTRGTLQLFQGVHLEEEPPQRFLGPVVDAGTGSGILAIAAAKLGWGPVFAFDNDPVALKSARENIAANGVQGVVEVHEVDVNHASPYWFADATVLANMTLEPVVTLVRRLASGSGRWGGSGPWGRRPRRLVVSGILSGAQERELLGVAGLCGFVPGQKLYEAGWVSLELLPAPAPDALPGGV